MSKFCSKPLKYNLSVENLAKSSGTVAISNYIVLVPGGSVAPGGD